MSSPKILWKYLHWHFTEFVHHTSQHTLGNQYRFWFNINSHGCIVKNIKVMLDIELFLSVSLANKSLPHKVLYHDNSLHQVINEIKTKSLLSQCQCMQTLWTFKTFWTIASSVIPHWDLAGLTFLNNPLRYNVNKIWLLQVKKNKYNIYVIISNVLMTVYKSNWSLRLCLFSKTPAVPMWKKENAMGKKKKIKIQELIQSYVIQNQAYLEWWSVFPQTGCYIPSSFGVLFVKTNGSIHRSS